MHYALRIIMHYALRITMHYALRITMHYDVLSITIAGEEAEADVGTIKAAVKKGEHPLGFLV